MQTFNFKLLTNRLLIIAEKLHVEIQKNDKKLIMNICLAHTTKPLMSKLLRPYINALTRTLSLLRKKTNDHSTWSLLEPSQLVLWSPSLQNLP